MTLNKPFAALVALLALQACDVNPTVSSSNIDPVSLAAAPPGAQPGSCWDKTITPAVVETQNRRVLLQPAQISSDGRVQQPPVYKTEEQQIVVQPRTENWFRIPCPDVLTPDLVASLQRALAARGHYTGTITGQIDPATHAAIQSFQRSEGSDSPTLTLATLQRLGLVPIDAGPTTAPAAA